MKRRSSVVPVRVTGQGIGTPLSFSVSLILAASLAVLLSLSGITSGGTLDPGLKATGAEAHVGPDAAFNPVFDVGTFVAFGPEDYIRSTKKPVFATDSFSVLNPHTSYTLHVYNGGQNNQSTDRVSSAVIKLNGAEVVSPSEFSQQVSHIEKPITLLKDNELAVEMRSGPGNRLTIVMTGVDNDPPTIVATLAPPPNAAGWNNTDVTVSFQCSDTTSGVASCSDPVLVATEGAGQVVTGRATDLAGNTASTSVTVNLDKTPPSVNIASPADGVVLDGPSVSVAGTVSDAVSGVAAVTCNGNPVSIVNSAFSSDVPLIRGANPITVEAMDVAGNTEHASITVIGDLRELELACVDHMQVEGRLMFGYSDTVSFYKPVVPSGFYAIGHYSQGKPNWPYGFVFAVKGLTPSAIAHPIDYEKVFGSIYGSSLSIWRPVPPEGYVSLGLAAAMGGKPSTDEIVCVREDLVAPGKVGNTIGLADGTGYRGNVWQIIPADSNGIFSGTFTAVNGCVPPPDNENLFCLDVRSVRTYEMDKQTIDSLVQFLGPWLRFDWREQYFLDDP